MLATIHSRMKTLGTAVLVVALAACTAASLTAADKADRGAAGKKELDTPEKIEAALQDAKISFTKDDNDEITSVTMGGKDAPFSPINLKLVGKLKSLKVIRTESLFDKITTEQLAGISAIKTLEELQFDCCEFTGSDLKKLATLPKLTTLNWTDSTIDDNGAKGLSTIKTLTVLKLSGNQISDNGLKALGNLKELEVLDLGKNLDDRQLRRAPPITDAGLIALKGMKQLKTLNLSGNLISDAGLKTISGIKTLEKLNVASTKVTEAGVAKFKELLPECTVETKDRLK